jgi:hypothetical protein
MKHFATLVFLLSLSLQTYGQRIPKVFVDLSNYEQNFLEVSDENEAIIKEQFGELISQYVYASNFQNDLGKFDEEKYNLYIELFSSNALVPNYLISSQKRIYYYDYVGFVEDKFGKNGIEFKLINGAVELRQITKNFSGSYLVRFSLQKEVKVQYDEKKQAVQWLQKPTLFTFEGVMEIDPENPAAAKITDLRMFGKEKGYSEKLNYVTMAAGFRYGTISTTSVPDANFKNLRPVLIGQSLQMSWLNSLNSNNSFYAWLGLDMSINQVRTNLNGKYEFDGNSSLTFSDEISVTRFSGNNFSSRNIPVTSQLQGVTTGEEILIGLFQLSGIIGVAYRKELGLKNVLFVRAGALPTYLFSSSSGSFEMVAEVYKDRNAINGNFPNLSELQERNVAAFYTNQPTEIERISGIQSNSNFSIGFLLAPVFQRQLSRKWNLEIGLAYHLGLNNFVKPSDELKPLIDERRLRSSTILEDYFSRTGNNHFQLTVGLAYKL